MSSAQMLPGVKQAFSKVGCHLDHCRCGYLTVSAPHFSRSPGLSSVCLCSAHRIHPISELTLSLPPLLRPLLTIPVCSPPGQV